MWACPRSENSASRPHTLIHLIVLLKLPLTCGSKACNYGNTKGSHTVGASQVNDRSLALGVDGLA